MPITSTMSNHVLWPDCRIFRRNQTDTIGAEPPTPSLIAFSVISFLVLTDYDIEKIHWWGVAILYMQYETVTWVLDVISVCLLCRYSYGPYRNTVFVHWFTPQLLYIHRYLMHIDHYKEKPPDWIRSISLLCLLVFVEIISNLIASNYFLYLLLSDTPMIYNRELQNHISSIW